MQQAQKTPPIPSLVKGSNKRATQSDHCAATGDYETVCERDVDGIAIAEAPRYHDDRADKSANEPSLEVRQDAGLKQADLAAAIGKRQSYVSDIERGQRRIDLLELYVIASALGMKPALLYERLTQDVEPGFAI